MNRYTASPPSADDPLWKHLFGAQETYPQMLWNIAAATGVFAFVCLWLVCRATGHSRVHGVRPLTARGRRLRISEIGACGRSTNALTRNRRPSGPTV